MDGWTFRARMGPLDIQAGQGSAKHRWHSHKTFYTRDSSPRSSCLRNPCTRTSGKDGPDLMAPPVAPDPADDQDFKDADQGFITSLNPCVIKDTNNNVVWDNDQYSFITGDCSSTAKPSLWRQSQLCYKQGLYLVTNGVNPSGIDSTKGIYQIRGLDIPNMSNRGIPKRYHYCRHFSLRGVRTAALSLYSQQFPSKPTTIKAIIFTHSRADHYGGAAALLPSEGTGDNTPIIAPDGFMEHTVSENVYAGNAMARRANYMYGDRIEKNESSQIGTGLGMIGSTGATTIVRPSVTIYRTDKELPPIDGVNIVYQVTPGTEAPSEMNFHFPDYKALCMTENATHTMHNIQTLRGRHLRGPVLHIEPRGSGRSSDGNQANHRYSRQNWQ
ncbi:MAG: hypothetical protein M1840_001504 [Geoglossum simile]|nr:MAG: hypothetical protein M1840_001504 [Geoglossum simile]